MKTAISLVEPEIQSYCELHSSPEPLPCRDIRKIAEQDPNGHWVCGAIVGNLLSLLVKLSASTRILEIGTFLGYSAAFLANESPNANVQSLEIEPYYARRATEILSQHAVGQQIRVLNVDALEWLKENQGPRYDFIFFDSDKSQFMAYYELLAGALVPGGILVADNMCLKGKVLRPRTEWEKQTKLFTSSIAADERFDSIFLPVRDGLLVATKKA